MTSHAIGSPMRLLTSLVPLIMTSLIVITSSTPLPPAAPPTPTLRTRWLTPCASGSLPVLRRGPTTDSTLVGAAGGAAAGATGGASLDVHDSFRVLGDKTMRLRRRVRELKTLYVRDLFLKLLLIRLKFSTSGYILLDCALKFRI